MIPQNPVSTPRSALGALLSIPALCIPALCLAAVCLAVGCAGSAALQSDEAASAPEPVKAAVFPLDTDAGSSVTAAVPGTAEEWIGRKAPDFIAPDHTGTAHRLSEVQARSELERSIVVLEWTSHVCSFVKRHYARSTVQSLVKTYEKRGVQWLAVDSSLYPIAHPVKIEKWVEERRIAHPILLDPEGVIGEAYGVKTTPTVIIIVDGTIVFHGGLDDDVWGRNADRREHVAEALDALLAGEEVPVATPNAYGTPVQYLSVENARREAREKAQREREEAAAKEAAEERAKEPAPPTPPGDER